MDSLITAAAQALAKGDALGALQRVALRDDPPALAVRGIAMAQLGELARARELLRTAARGFGSREVVARARCVVAEAEVALAMRDLSGTPRALEAAAATLDARGDHANALQARLISIRRMLLLGRLDDAATHLAEIGMRPAPPSLAAISALIAAELGLRSLRTADARVALTRAHALASRAGVPALRAEIAELAAALDHPAARLLRGGVESTVRLDEIEALFASGAMVVDACRHGIRRGYLWQPLASRPVLFALARELATAWPGDVDRGELIARVFRTRHPDETHRARLRVEIGRLRKEISTLAQIDATARGFVLKPVGEREVAVLAPPIEGDEASLVALLADGAAWSTSALALALDANQRTVQRALVELEAEGRVRSIGRARAQRWLAPSLAGFTTILLLPAALASQ